MPQPLNSSNIEQLLLYRDACILVLNKPAGIMVHKGPYPGDHIDRYFDGLKFGLPKPPQLAHRLDRDTSGCLLLGRHAKATTKLGKMFKEGKIQKTYLAVVEGSPPEEKGDIHLPLLKIGEGAKWQIIVDEKGQTAHTSYEVISQKDGRTLVKLTPYTGRTHQLRIHMQALGCPIWGDWKYGREMESQRMMLHAWKINIPYYKNKDAIDVTAPMPEYFTNSGLDLPPSV